MEERIDTVSRRNYKTCEDEPMGYEIEKAKAQNPCGCGREKFKDEKS
jgi:hypothetical protein